MAGIKVWGFTVLKSDAEKTIRLLFDNYVTKLNEQKTKLTDDITEWSDALIRSIYKYSTQQKYLLEQEYVAQMENLKRSLKDFLDELHVHEIGYDDHRINGLVDQCKELKFELSALETNAQSIPFLQLPSRENFSSINRDEQFVTGCNETIFDDASLDKSNKIFKPKSRGRTSSFEFNGSVNSSTRFCTQSLTTNPVYSDRIETNNGYTKRSVSAIKNGLIEKCPICFMIYPISMTKLNRSEHVDEHYIDNK